MTDGRTVAPMAGSPFTVRGTLGWRSVFGWSGMGLIVLFLVAIAVDARRFTNTNTGDTNNLATGSRVLIECIRSGDFVGCGRYDGSIQTAVFPYPLLQYVPATVFAWLGWSDAEMLSGLRWLSYCSLLGILALFLLAFREQPRLIYLSWAVLIGSSLLYLANAAFGEALASLAVLAAVVAAAGKRPVLVAALASVACLGKETLAPFVILLCLLCARELPERLLPSARLLWPIIGGSAFGVMLSGAFNVLRFGGPRNALYLGDEFRTAGVGRQIEWFVALWLSPAGGVAWFWPAFTLVMIASAVVAVRRSRLRDKLLDAAPALALVAWVGGLSLWFAPFGWITFGPRLAVPLLPALLFTVLWRNGEQILRLLGATNARASITVAAVSIASIPMYGSPWRWWNAVQDLITPGSATCPPMTGLSIQDDADEYYRCTSATMWRRRPQILDDTITWAWTTAGMAWLLALVGCVCLLIAALVPGAGRSGGSYPPDSISPVSTAASTAMD
jgi:hypothetical protein